MRVLAMIAMVLCLPAAALADESPRLTVTGTGEVDAAPDMATLRFGVEHEDRRAEAAMAAVSADMARILERLSAAGVAPRDMQTSGLSLSPVWTGYDSGKRREITGFHASNQLTVRVRGLEGIGGLLDRVITEGANSFQGISFGLQGPEPLQDEARRRAVAEALRKAELYAEAAGVSLGSVISISESGSSDPRPVMMEAARMASAPVPVAAGEVSLSARVTMVFEIEN
ncbi:SIMPL domain-containing protein [Rhodovulum adriaticum]|uniref:Secreted protein n=1 Tax=Rhodovulum adriaticum TaxID=35804 RepID=A0A4R2NJ92_RHOAD|nr:SIMPL domain-containing protein [Rhodovulum adriaticum]MBK1635852.1 hypothetical protein [Rhodovulum adriaticum]TCP21392.1 hypothetical protein EV656_11143 [Rhodovulum adriaticum]